MDKPIRVFIIDDCVYVRDGIKQAITEAQDIEFRRSQSTAASRS